MADTSTTHLNLIKQDPNAAPDIDKEHANLEILDTEVWARAKTFNGETVDANGGFNIRRIPYADNLESGSSQKSDESYIIRTSGGEASINDGDAWLMMIRGSRVHTGYTEQDVEMTVTPMEREEPITATIDDDAFISAVSSASGTMMFTYGADWSANPANYGITVNGTPVAGDVITVTYVKEVRGTITQSNPQTFVSTGWNLYNHENEYAKVIKYSDSYGFKISGSYISLSFAYNLTDEPDAITPVSGGFNPFANDDPIGTVGYVFVTGGNNTDTQLWMTWSDWGTQANGGVFAGYTTSMIDFTTFMGSNFPYGLMQVGDIRDEINLNIGIATSYIERQAYNSVNIAAAKASGRQYEYDENYIYIERSSPVQYMTDVEGDYIANDHGIESFTGTDVAVYAETIYGANLKNKLERDVLTISGQTLTEAQKVQVRSNIDAASGTAFEKFQMTYLNKATDDLDNLYNTSDTGFYLTSGVTLNSPATYSNLIVAARSGTCYQTIISPTYIYMRARTGNPPTWSAWNKIPTGYYEQGKQYAVVAEAFGYITSNTTTMFVSAIMPKAFDRAPTITRLDIVARGNNGYVDVFTEAKNVFSQSGFTVSCAVRDARTLRIEIKKTTALTNATNNTPINVAISNLTFTA